ncbi:MAG: hypothetical protein ACYC9U_07275 [Nitrososphaerales archaeon]
MKKFTHLVICPKCSLAFNIEDIMKHLDSHSAQAETPKPAGA